MNSLDRSPVDDCVHCGFCLPTCPTYVLWGEEGDSPRGRIALVKEGLVGPHGSEKSAIAHIDRCLGCMACVTACPSGVRYDLLLSTVRPQVERQARRSWFVRLFRWLIFELFPYPTRLRWLAWPLLAYQKLGLQVLVRRSGVLKLLPSQMQAMEYLMPPLTSKSLKARIPARLSAGEPRRRRVGLLLGCVQRVFFPEVNAATARVLMAEGCDVIVPPSQGCCGALASHAGEEDRARDAARAMIDCFDLSELDAIVINAAGCGSAMKEYGHLLRDDSAYASRATEFSAKCRDISEFLSDLEPRTVRHPLALRVAYHNACHLQHAQGIRTQPRALLRAIPGLEILEIPESEICCGSAGIYNMLQPDAANALRDRKVSKILSLRPDLIVSSNPGCLLQISTGLNAVGLHVPTTHLVQLLDASIAGHQVGASLI